MKKRIVKEFLRHAFTQKELGEINSSFDIIGDIAIIKIPTTLKEKENFIAGL